MIEINPIAQEAIVDLDENSALILTEDRELVFEDSNGSKVFLSIHTVQDFEALLEGMQNALTTIKKENREDIMFSSFNTKKFN